MARESYEQIPELQGFYFEDSFVLSLSSTPREVWFVMLAVLTPAHPEYRPPERGDQHTYQKTRLTFPEPTRVQWSSVKMLPAMDADGTVDFDGIDAFWREDDRYHLAGSWGEVDVWSPRGFLIEAVKDQDRLLG